ncbi:hypothetical protein F5148DRAFT_418611 [Russula earlei]|uniref:Uncharacterized protein n=1 Tax=Russula earlei TaxID=71964 RepID=A0ACC0TZH6_9AGAM|nr:hypothetical protein F5148DRAFT_418611 [Russula earlei]
MVLAPPPAFPGDVAWNLGNLLSSWIVGPLYGIICVYILCARVLYLKGLQGVNLLMLIVASVQFALATGHVSTLVVELIRGFLNPAWTPGGTSLYLLNPAEPERIAQAAMYLTNSLIGDAILIWRLWILWNRNFFITAPFIMLCIGTAAASYTALVHLSHLSLTDTVFVARVHDWLTATWALSIATQFGATLLIVYRFWICIQWNVKGIRESRLAVLWILVESGALYSVTTIFMLGFSTTNTGGIISSALGQISVHFPYPEGLYVLCDIHEILYRLWAQH